MLRRLRELDLFRRARAVEERSNMHGEVIIACVDSVKELADAVDSIVNTVDSLVERSHTHAHFTDISADDLTLPSDLNIGEVRHG